MFHDLLYQPAIGPLLLMGRVTERVRLGPAALNPFTLHPYEIAGQIAMLDAVSNGRAYLGLAKGAWLDRLGIEEARPLAALREAVAIIRALLAGDESGFEGERFTLRRARGSHTRGGGSPCRCSSGPGGRRRHAGRARWPTRSRSAEAQTPSCCLSFATGSATPRVKLVVGCVTVVDEDGDWARERARAAVEPYLEVVAQLDPTLELRGGQAPPLDRFCIAGTPDEVADAWSSCGTRARTASSSERRRDARR